MTPPQPDIADLVARIEQLEEQVKESDGRAANRVLEASSLVIRDRTLRVRAMLGLNPEGESLLSLYDEDSNRRAALGVTKDGPVFQFYDQNERLGVSMALSDGARGIIVYSPSGSERLELIWKQAE
jgi:hypothetical protein